MLNVCQNTCFWRWCNLRSHGVVPFSEFPMSHFYQKIVCIPIAEIVGVTFFTCWCVEFHGESNPPYKLCVTSAVSSNHYSCYYTIYIYTTNRMGHCGVQHGLSIKHGERLPKWFLHETQTYGHIISIREIIFQIQLIWGSMYPFGVPVPRKTTLGWFQP